MGGGVALFIAGGVLICRQMSALGHDQPQEQGADAVAPGEGDAAQLVPDDALAAPERSGRGPVPGHHEPALARRRRPSTAVGVAPGDLSRDLHHLFRPAAVVFAPLDRRGGGADYTKGIDEQFLAVERLLEVHPEFRERFVFV